MIQRVHDGVRWQLQPDFAPVLDELLKTAKRAPGRAASPGGATAPTPTFLARHENDRWARLRTVTTRAGL